MNLNKAFSRMFSLLCFLGFLLQLQQVSDLYFHFYTTSKTEFQIQEVDNYQSLVFCPRWLDVLDRNQLLNKYNTKLVTPKSDKELDQILGSLTIKQILELTPTVSTVILDCMIREDNISAPMSIDKKECHKIFKVIKSVNGERICYTFMPRVRMNYSVGNVASSQSWTNIVYQISLNPILGNTFLAFFISEFIDPETENDPLDSRLYQIKVQNIDGLNKSRFAVYGEKITIHRLPPPYDTKCTPGHDRELCFEECLVAKLQIINKTSWSGFHSEMLEKTMLTSLDLYNYSRSKTIVRSFHLCHSSCKLKTECSTHFSRTAVHVYRASTMAVISMVPAGPNLNLHSVPFVTLIEYVVQIGSCFGVWFGLSIMSINPSKWKISRIKNSTSIVINNRPRRLFVLTKIKKQVETGTCVNSS